LTVLVPISIKDVSTGIALIEVADRAVSEPITRVDTVSKVTDVLVDRDPVACKAVSDDIPLVMVARRVTLQATTRDVPINATSDEIILLSVAKRATSDTTVRIDV